MTNRILRTACTGLLMLVGTAASQAQTIAITGGRVFTATGTTIESATVLIRDGRIVEMGAGVAVPAGATRIDATGKWVTPGFIEAAGSTGLVEIGAVQSTVESSNSTGALTASFTVLEGVNPASQLIPATRIEGVTTVNARPNGGLVPGQSAVLDLLGDRIEEMLVKSPATLTINMSATGAAGGSRAGVMALVRTLFADALEYDGRREEYARGQMRDLAAPVADLEALLPALRGEMPVLFGAGMRSEIENVMRLADEFSLDAVIAGGTEAWQVAGALAARGIPVIVAAENNIPGYGGMSARLDNAAMLEAAGVTVILATFDGHNVRNLRQMAGIAVAHGMSHGGALRAITSNPADMLGLDDYGRLEAGAVANVVVWSGDPFEFSSSAEVVLIRGARIEMTSRQTELLERYLTLPDNQSQ